MKMRKFLQFTLLSLLIIPLVAFTQVGPVEQDENPATGTVRGTVIQGTADSTVPENMLVQLHIMDREMSEEVLEAQVGADGTFVFTDVSLDAEHGFVVSAHYQSITYMSEFVQGEPGITELELPVTIYEMTNDPAVIQINSLRSQIYGDGGGLQVLQIISLVNISDRLFVGDTPASSDILRTISLPLPEGATAVDMFEDGRYTLSEDGRIVHYTRAIAPGQPANLHHVFTLPYNDQAANIDQQFAYPLNGMIEVMLAAPGLSLTSDMLPFLGSETINGTAFDGYGNTMTLNAGELIQYELQGELLDVAAPVAAQTTGGESGSDNSLSTLLVAAGGILIGFAGVLFFRDRFVTSNATTGAPAMSIKEQLNTLLQQVADLDREHEAGGIDDGRYTQERTALKTQIASLMQQSTQGA